MAPDSLGFLEPRPPGAAVLVSAAHRMRHSALLAAIVLLGVGPAGADTLYQLNAEGKQVVIQRDAIVVKDDSSMLVYKHFDLKERRVVKVTLNKGSLAYSVVLSSQPERQQIVENWKRFGYKATVSDQAGKTTRVSDGYVDFYPPGGRGSLLESLPARTIISVVLAEGGVDEIEFSRIERVEFPSDRVRVVLRTGQAEEGQLLKPTDRPFEARFLGITDHYDPASEDVFDFALPLARLREIRFEP